MTQEESITEAKNDIDQLTIAISFEANILDRAKKEYKKKKKSYFDRIEYLKKVVSGDVVR